MEADFKQFHEALNHRLSKLVGNLVEVPDWFAAWLCYDQEPDEAQKPPKPVFVDEALSAKFSGDKAFRTGSRSLRVKE